MSTFWLSNIHLFPVDCSLVAEQCPPLDCLVTTWVSAGSVSAALCCVAAWTRIEKQFVRIFSTLCTTGAHWSLLGIFSRRRLVVSSCPRLGGLSEYRWGVDTNCHEGFTTNNIGPTTPVKFDKLINSGVCFDSSSEMEMGETSPCRVNICKVVSYKFLTLRKQSLISQLHFRFHL